MERSKAHGGRDAARAARTDASAHSDAQGLTPALTPEAAAHETMHLCRLIRPWTCDHCQKLIRKNELAQVHVKAGIPRNLVYHDTCEPVRQADS